MSEPRWLSKSAADIAHWVSLQDTRDLIEWIEWEAAKAKDGIADDVIRSGGQVAKILGGRLTALEDIVRSFDKPAALPEVPDEPFRDPAERKRPNSQTHTARTSDDSGTE